MAQSDRRQERTNGHPLLDDSLIRELEDTAHEETVIGGYERGQRQENDTVNFAEGWFPGGEQWKGKTIISPSQAKSLAVARQLSTIFPRLTDIQPFIDNVLNDYEIYLTSVEGQARDQHEKILRAAFGDQSLPEQGEGQSITIFESDDQDDD